MKPETRPFGFQLFDIMADVSDLTICNMEGNQTAVIAVEDSVQ